MNIHFWIEIFLVIALTFALHKWDKERIKARDYGNDLINLIYKEKLGSDDLRRSLRHEEIRNRV